MARKRKKKKKGRRSQTERRNVTAPADEEASVDAAPVIESGQAVDEGVSVDEVIELEGDLDDPDARAALIAAAAALESAARDPASEAGSEDESGDRDPEAELAVEAESTSSRSADGPGDLEPGAGVAVDADAALEATSSADADRSSATGGEAGPIPLIGPDALLALSQFRAEGIATLPEELVLDLGEATTPEQRDRLLAAALAHVEMQDAVYRVPLESGASRRWKGTIAALLFIMALFLAGLPPSFLVPDAPTPLTNAERLRGLRVALLLQAQQVEAFRAREGRLPSTLAEVATASPGIRFVKSNNRLYQLIAYSRTGNAVVFDSSAPDPEFDEAMPTWLLPGGL